MTLKNWSFTLAALLLTILGMAGATFVASSSRGLAQAPNVKQSLAYFDRIAPVLQHPRCMNCHTSTDFPRQGDDGHPHIMSVKRGPQDSGMAALQCSTCHQKANSPSGVPGNEVWHLAPLRMAWEGLTPGAICRSLTDPAKGGMTYEKLVEHMASDPLVAWAWTPGTDLTGEPRSTPPVSHADFGQLVRDWVASGAACPD